MRNGHDTRRGFIKKSAAIAAAASIPSCWPGSLARAEGANDKITVASIGIGGSRGRYNRGRHIAQQARNLGRTIAVCDVDSVHNDEFVAECKEKCGYDINKYTDYRELLEKEKPDVVTIGTPDHWHVPIAIAALRAGCDVYCEKPLTLTIDEGKKICQVVQETGKVFQVGTQQRSECNQHFLTAIAMVRLGMLGANVKAALAIGGAPEGGPFPSTEVPEGLDWDFWLGPAPARDYSIERRMYFRWFLEYSGGKMTDWGAHHIDIAQWALSPEQGPVSVHGTGTFGPGMDPAGYDVAGFFNGAVTLPDSYNAPIKFKLLLKYANGTSIDVNDEYVSEDGKTHFGNGILFTGDQERIFVARGKVSGTPYENLVDADKAKIKEYVETELYRGPVTGHMQNFFDCLKDRNRLPVSDIYSHCDCMDACHICNANLLLGRDLNWNPKKKVFVGDDEANKLLTRKSRDKYLA
jgi:predicted dehydrogenase